MFIALTLFVLRTTASQSINNSEFVVLSGIAMAVIGMKHAMSVKSYLKLDWVFWGFLNGDVLRNLNMHSFPKLCPIGSATCLSDEVC